MKKLALLALLALTLAPALIACGGNDGDTTAADSLDTATDDLVGETALDATADTAPVVPPLPNGGERGTLTACGGETIAYGAWKAEGATATLLFVNGRTEYTDKYAHVLDLITQTDQAAGRPARAWNVVMFDHYGQGRSSGVRAHSDGYDLQQVCFLKAVVDEVIDPALPLVIIAHSMGGLVATRYVQQNPTAAKALVASSPMYGFPTGDLSDEEARGFAKNMTDAGSGTVPTSTDSSPRPPCAQSDVTHDCELYDLFKDDLLTMIGAATFGWVDKSFAAIDALFADGTLPVPFLLLQAGQETVVLPEKHTAFCDAVNAANPGRCTLQTFPDDRHELFNELDRAAVMEAALTFLDTALQ